MDKELVAMGIALLLTNTIWFLHELLWHKGEHL